MSLANGSLRHLPSDWQIAKLDDLKSGGRYSFVGGPFGSNLTRNDYVDEPGVPVIRGTNLGGATCRFIDSGFVFVTEAKADSLVQNLAYPGDLVFTQRGTLGQVVEIPKSANYRRYVVSQSQMKLAVDESKAHARYIYHYYQSPRAVGFLNQRIQATGVPHINLEILKEFPILLPPIEQQRRIAAILDKADAIRRKREEGIRLTEELLRSTFLEMFGDPVANPKAVPTLTLGDVAHDMTYGTSQKCDSEQTETSLPVLRIPNILHGRVNWSDLKFADLPTKDVRQLSLKPGDTLFVRTNGNPEYIGRCAVFSGDSPCLFASYLIRVRLGENSSYRPRFLQQVVTMPSYRALLVAEARTTAGNYNISTQGLRRLRLIAPSIEAQDEYLKAADKILAMQDHRDQARSEAASLFDALAQRAFRGEL